MFGIDPNVLMLGGMAFVAVGGLAYAFLFNSIESEKKTDARLNAVSGDRKERSAKAAARLDDATKRKQREEALKTLDDQRNAVANAKNPPLSVKLLQGGFKIKPKQFWTVSIVLGLAAAAVAFMLRAPLYIVPLVGIIVGFGGPQWWINRTRNRRFNKFVSEFPNAIDVICRGIKSGLPLNDCLRIIARDAEEPVRTEFQKVVEAQQMGLSMMDSIARLAKNIPLQETNFFSIVIAIQSQAGGNLAEALQNLSNTLRERKKMKDKIGALSMEAKASAYIIGALPFVVAGLVQLSSPAYLEPLYAHPTGQFNMMIAGGLMLTGTFILKKMINFDF